MKERGIRFRLEHVGVAVESLDEASAQWSRLLGLETSSPERVESEGVRLSFLDVENSRVELLEGLSDGSPISRFLERRGSGVHHLSFEIEGVGIDEWFETLARRGARLIGEGPRPGADGCRVFFVHPASTGGVLIEFSQRSVDERDATGEPPSSTERSDT